ncbi:hypothetical protein SALBM311S_09873 [Streptomyces alboniger]
MREGLAGRVLPAAGVALMAWLAALWTTLPNPYPAQHWRVAWVGFDALEITGVLTSAVLVRRGDHRASPTSIATAVLFLVDAWFDVMTAGRDVIFSLVMACTLELPLAMLCAVTALRPPGVASVQAAVVPRAVVHV